MRPFPAAVAQAGLELEVAYCVGGVISPLLANVYLHYVFDLWAHHWRESKARGDVVIVRFADDLVIGFQYWADAERFKRELQERFLKFALELNPDKTRLVEFGRFAARDRRLRGVGRPETFDFLGFTHICGTKRNGEYLLVRRTARKRMSAKLREVKTELMRRRHLPVPAQGEWLASVVRGHAAYYAVPTNIFAVAAFRREAVRLWHRALSRRSQKARIPWARMARYRERWIPRSRILHPWPNQRFDVTTQGRSPVR